MRSFLPLTSVVFGVRQKLLDEDNLPSVFNLDDKAITVAFDVEDSVWVHEIGMRVHLPHIHKTSPTRVFGNLIPL
jgi:hypothetical protein